MPISKLQDADVNRLRSSQAIHTPCSIVKELVENALDAGASNISIEVDDTAIGSITVKDNGNGVYNENGDRESMCLPFTTSKISTFEDLETVSTLGFRGEALSSIAQLVSSMELTTRTKEDSVASKWSVSDNGIAGRFKAAADPVGTTIIVKNLFKDMPVRRKLFLKNQKKSTADIKDLIFRFALVNLNVRMSLKISGKQPHNMTYPTGRQLKDMISGYAVRSFQKNICVFTEVKETIGEYTFNCLLSRAPHELSETSQSLIKKKVLIFGINGRLLANNLTTVNQLLKVFRQLRPPSDMKEICFLHIQCPPACLDVNVEPSKDDVLFQDCEGFVRAWESVLTKAYPSRDALDVLMRNRSTTLPLKSSNIQALKSPVHESMVPVQSTDNSPDNFPKGKTDVQLFLRDGSEEELYEPSHNTEVTNTKAPLPSADPEAGWSFSMHDCVGESSEEEVLNSTAVDETERTMVLRSPTVSNGDSEGSQINKIRTPPPRSMNLDTPLPSDHNLLSPLHSFSVESSDTQLEVRSMNEMLRENGGHPLTPIPSSPIPRYAARSLRRPNCPPSLSSAPPSSSSAPPYVLDKGMLGSPGSTLNKSRSGNNREAARIKQPNELKQMRLEVNKTPSSNADRNLSIWASKYGISGDLRNYKTIYCLRSLDDLLKPSRIEIGGMHSLDIEILAAFLEEKYCANSLEIDKSPAGWHTLRDVQ